jgi:hypothetical protein
LFAFGGFLFAPVFFLRLQGKRFFIGVGYSLHFYFYRCSCILRKSPLLFFAPLFLLAALQQFLFLMDWFWLLDFWTLKADFFGLTAIKKARQAVSR